MPPTERQSRILWTSVTALAVGVLVALVGLLLWGLGWTANRLSSVLLPLAIAGVLAFILDPVVGFFERRTRSRIGAIWLVFALALLIVLALASTVLPRLVSEIESFVSQVPTLVTRGRKEVSRLLHHPPRWLPSAFLKAIPAPPPLPAPSPQANDSSTNNIPIPLATADSANVGWNFDLSAQLFSYTTKVLPRVGFWMLDQLSRVASVAGLLAGLALVPVYLFYFLLEKQGIQRRWQEFLPLRESRTKEELVFVLGAINDCLIVFFRGQVLVAMCVGTILSVGFAVVGLNYALLLGVMAGILGIVPYLGVAMSLIPAVIIAVVQFGDWAHPLGVLAVFATAQTLEGLVISPRIIGNRVGLHPLTIIIAVMVGTTLLGGILGGVLAIPLTAVLRTVMLRYVWVKSQQPTT